MATTRPLTIIQIMADGIDFTGVAPNAGPDVVNSVSIFAERTSGGLFTFNLSIYHSLERVRWEFGSATSFTIKIKHVRGEETTLVDSGLGDDAKGVLFFDFGRTLAPGEQIIVNTAGVVPGEKPLAEVLALPLSGEYPYGL